MNASDTFKQWTMLDWGSVIRELYSSKSVHTKEPTHLIEEWWISLVNYFGDFNLLFAFYMFMNLTYLVCGLIFWICDRYHLLDSFKIQAEVSKFHFLMFML